MNGYAAVFEVAITAQRSLGGTGAVEDIGILHAAETDATGRAPERRTLCGMDTTNMQPAPLDQPATPWDTWLPPLPGPAEACRECDRLASAPRP